MEDLWIKGFPVSLSEFDIENYDKETFDFSLFYKCDFKSILDLYLLHYDNLKIRTILKDAIEHFLNTHSPEIFCLTVVPIYILARLYNINSQLNINRSVKISAAKEILEAYNNIVGKKYNFRDLFIFDNVNDTVDYMNYLHFVSNYTFTSPYYFLECCISLADIDTVFRFAKEYINIHLREEELTNSLAWQTILFMLLTESDFDNHTDYIHLKKKIMSFFGGNIFTKEEKKNFAYLTGKISALSILDNTCISFFILALHIKEYLDNSIFVDYSMCSLQYYKIVEVSLKNILKKAIQSNGINNRDVFNDIVSYRYVYRNCVRFNEHSNNVFIRNWIDSLTLEKIHNLFEKFIVYFLENSAEGSGLSNSTKLFLREINNQYSNAETYGYIIDCTHPDVLKIYRNPPAHTKPCGRNVADEAEDIMINLFKYMLNDGNNINVDLDNLDADTTNGTAMILVSIARNRDTLNNVLSENKRFRIG